MADNFEREVDEWFDKLEEQLAPPGRVTPAGPPDDGPTRPERPVLSHPSTLAQRRPVKPDLGQTVARESMPAPDADQQMVDLAQLADQKRELVRTEALVDVMKELVAEIRSVRRDVDQIKAIIAKLRRLAEAKRRRMASPASTRRSHPSG